MNKYNFYNILFSVIGSLIIGTLFGYYYGLISIIIFHIYSFFKLGLNKEENKNLIENFKFTR